MINFEKHPVYIACNNVANTMIVLLRYKIRSDRSTIKLSTKPQHQWQPP